MTKTITYRGGILKFRMPAPEEFHEYPTLLT